MLVPLLLGAGENKPSIGSSAVSDETRHSLKVGTHVITLWWLPVEYWEAAARELGKSGDTIDRVRTLLRSYVILAMVDADIQPNGSFTFASLESANQSLILVRDGREVSPVLRIGREVGGLLPELSYFMVTGLGVMSGGLRLVLFSNIDEEGRPLVSGARPGRFAVRYKLTGPEPVSAAWRAPLTSVVGPRRCPKGGESLEASWAYCPWHGVPVE
jgi:hypothetical protein